jgi:pseudouridylate synthase
MTRYPRTLFAQQTTDLSPNPQRLPVNTPWNIVNRAGPNPVALETTLLCHGVPPETAPTLADDLADIVEKHGASPSLVGVFNGRPTVGLTKSELTEMLDADEVQKVNTANLGLAIHNKTHAATTVSTTMELAAAAGIRVFATGGIGGVHRNYGSNLDISSDLTALTRFPVAVVTSGVKSLLDVISTREALETLGIPVIGFQTDTFPAFYLRDGGCAVDARFDDPAEVAYFITNELARTGRGIVIANPIPEDAELDQKQWKNWLEQASDIANNRGATGREVTPTVLALLHEVSEGKTLEANIALIRSNTDLAARIAVH